MSDPNQTPIKYTRTASVAPPRSRQDIPLPEGVVAVEPGKLDAGQRAVAARIAGVAPGVVDTLARAGLPLPLAEADSVGLAKARMKELEGQLPGLVAVRPASAMVTWPLAAGFATATAGVLLGLIGLPFLGITAPVVSLILTLAVMAVVVVVGVGQSTQLQARYKQSFDLLRDAGQVELPEETRAAALLRRAGELRARVAASELPEIAQDDLNETLDGLNAELPALARREAEGEDLSATLDELEAALEALSASLNTQDPSRPQASELAARLRTQARAVERSAQEMSPDEAKRQAAQRQAQKKLQ